MTQPPTFEKIVTPLLGELQSAARSLTHDADDLVQEVLLKAYRAYSSFKTDTNFRAWIHRILFNTFASNFRRHRNGLIAYSTTPTDEYVAAGSPVTEVAPHDLDALGEQLGDELKDALMEMKPEFREVFIRAAVNDATTNEIAQALNIPVGTVMSRMHRGRIFLRKAILRAREQYSN